MGYGICEECGRYGPTQGHHVIYKSKGGLDFPLNIKDLGSPISCNCHNGPQGPHHNKNKDKQYKKQLELNIRQVLTKEYYDMEEVQKLIKIENKQLWRVFKTLQYASEGYRKEDIIKQLLGGSFYIGVSE